MTHVRLFPWSWQGIPSQGVSLRQPCRLLVLPGPGSGSWSVWEEDKARVSIASEKGFQGGPSPSPRTFEDVGG